MGSSEETSTEHCTRHKVLLANTYNSPFKGPFQLQYSPQNIGIHTVSRHEFMIPALHMNALECWSMIKTGSSSTCCTQYQYSVFCHLPCTLHPVHPVHTCTLYSTSSAYLYPVQYIQLGVCDYQNMWYHDFADYCLESITINRLIGDLDNSAANKTIQLLQVLKVMLMPSADYQFNRSLQCASKIASAI